MEGIIPENVVRNKGVTTADLTIGKAGQWMLRTRANFPNAHWSEVTFVVAPSAKKFQPIQKLIQPMKKLQ